MPFHFPRPIIHPYQLQVENGFNRLEQLCAERDLDLQEAHERVLKLFQTTDLTHGDAIDEECRRIERKVPKKEPAVSGPQDAGVVS